VIVSNISAQQLILFEEFLAKGQGQVTTNVAEYVLYKKASVKLQLAKDVLDKYPAKDLAMYDLVSGAKMDAQFREMPGGGGEWSADVSAGKGSYKGQWSGGGCFGVGLTAEGKSAGVSRKRGVVGMETLLAGVGLMVMFAIRG